MKKGVLIVVGISIFAFLFIVGWSSLQRTRNQTGTQVIPSTAAILFESNKDTGERRKEIYTMNRDGGDVTRITFSTRHHFLTGIDPSGRYLVTTCADQDTALPSGLGDEDRRGLWVLDTVTGSETRLTAHENQAEGHSVSPDGQWVVFHMQLSGEMQSDLYKIKLSGENLTRLTFTEDASECDPAWSPNGQEIAYTCFTANTSRFQLKIQGIDGANGRVIYDPVDAVATSLFPRGVYDPSWSPNGQWITFEKPIHFADENGGAGIWHICKIHPDGSDFIDLSLAGGHSEWAEYLPSFSQDGAFIIFSARVGPSDAAKTQVDIYVMESTTGSVQRLTNGLAIEDYAIWV